VLAFDISLSSDAAITAERLRAKYRETLRQLGGIPSVEEVSLMGGSLPMTGDSEVPFGSRASPSPSIRTKSHSRCFIW
jgi:hypothetical protein